ncbi:cytochrome o ubiquinol oxidase subunit IV [Crenobacter sp. SG2303]|uniref:Cytochrome bo(3) ubiquinol oxidase subunit 4 n=1 Tax=Crenobacter oryzisoli TaxID=3056844 RepID=A0ABT7XUA1_9NEIS|nr:cytochrome o ubiquinol oxidase subunit IV [Crenobacter sp. SG2303]MDN0077373.1 cytochrome o ubiquinol oxidase subunit IV [Crenobacter sp. SG2303]
MSTHDEMHPDHGDEHGDIEEVHATLKGYLTGFVLAAGLTIIPFWLVMGGVFTKSGPADAFILLLAAVQIVVHAIYFLHMNTKSEGGWNLLALIFTLVLVVITLSGSVWIMFHLNDNMMPMTLQQARNLP